MVGRIVGQRAETDQVQHLDRGIARQGLEGVELGAGGVDAGHGSSGATGASGTLLIGPYQKPEAAEGQAA